MKLEREGENRRKEFGEGVVGSEGEEWGFTPFIIPDIKTTSFSATAL